MADQGMVEDPLSLKNKITGTLKGMIGMNRGMVAPNKPTPIAPRYPMTPAPDTTATAETTVAEPAAAPEQMPPGLPLVDQIKWRNAQPAKALNP